MVPEVFRQACVEEASAVFELIMGRVRWMDEKGIRQWNVTNYDDCYPLTYYEAACRRGDLFVMTAAGKIISCAVLKQEDDRWPQAMQAAEPAFTCITLPPAWGKGAWAASFSKGRRTMPCSRARPACGWIPPMTTPS